MSRAAVRHDCFYWLQPNAALKYGGAAVLKAKLSHFKFSQKLLPGDFITTLRILERFRVCGSADGDAGFRTLSESAKGSGSASDTHTFNLHVIKDKGRHCSIPD